MADLKKTLPPFVGRTSGIGEILSALQPELQRVEQEARMRRGWSCGSGSWARKTAAG